MKQYMALNEDIDELSEKFVYHKILTTSKNQRFGVIEMLMYALYKQDKISYIVDFLNTKSDMDVQDGLEDKLKKFQLSKCNDGMMEYYRHEATRILQQLFNSVLQDKNYEIKKIEEQLQDKIKKINEQEKRMNKMEKDIKQRYKFCPEKTPFWHGILQSLIASFIVILSPILFTLTRHYDKFKQIMDILFDKK